MIWRTDIELNSTEIKGGRIFKYCGELMQKNWRTLGRRLVNVIRPSVFANWHLSNKLGFYPPTETGERGPILLDDYISKGWLPVL